MSGAQCYFCMVESGHISALVGKTCERHSPRRTTCKAVKPRTQPKRHSKFGFGNGYTRPVDEHEVRAAYACGMSLHAVARLFRIGTRRAHRIAGVLLRVKRDA